MVQASTDNPPLTEDELREIRERSEKATAGPWRVTALEEHYHSGMGCTPDGCPGHPGAQGTWVEGPKLDEYGDSYEGEEYDQACADARFIAHSRTDVIRLLDTIKADRAEIGRLEQSRDAFKETWGLQLQESRRLYDRVQELHSQLSTATRTERDRCAKIADDEAARRKFTQGYGTALAIATQIRTQP